MIRRAPVIIAAGIAIMLLLALGIWQVERRAWKLALIARVEQRLAAAPVAAPGPRAWPHVDAPRAEYLKVRLNGRFLPCRTRRVQAVTVLGPGYWLLTPLAETRGFTVFVNRGFVPEDRPLPPCGAGVPPPVAVTGLLRLDEPSGGFLRRNDPAADRWYSRDVVAMGRGLPRLAPYFVDADGPTAGWPRGGLTVVRFRNSHLVYALTWFGLAILLAVMTWRVLRRPPAA